MRLRDGVARDLPSQVCFALGEVVTRDVRDARGAEMTLVYWRPRFPGIEAPS